MEILIFPFFLKNEDRNTIGMEKQDLRLITRNMVMIKKTLLGDYAFMRPKLILFVLIYRKKKKRSIS